jgi:hypothetical protein
MKKTTTLLFILLLTVIQYSHSQELEIHLDSTFGINGIFDTLEYESSSFESMSLYGNQIKSIGYSVKYNNKTQFLFYNFYPYPKCHGNPAPHAVWWIEHNPKCKNIIKHNNNTYVSCDIDGVGPNTYVIFKFDSTNYLDCSFGLNNNYFFGDYLGGNNHKIIDMEIYDDMLYILTDSNTTKKTLYRLTLDGVMDSTFGIVNFNDTTVEQISKTKLKINHLGIFITISKLSNNNYRGYCYKLTYNGQFDSTFNYTGIYELYNISNNYVIEDIFIDNSDYYLVGMITSPGNHMFIKKLSTIDKYITFDFSFNFVHSLRIHKIQDRIIIFGKHHNTNKIFSMDISDNLPQFPIDTNMNYINLSGNVQNFNDIIFYDTNNFYLCGDYFKNSKPNAFIIKGSLIKKSNNTHVENYNKININIFRYDDIINIVNDENTPFKIELYDITGRFITSKILTFGDNRIQVKNNQLVLIKISVNNQYVVKIL